MAVSERVARRKESTRERIVAAAMELFLSRGFEATSVAQISQAADIGKGTFFTYFATKQEVLSFLGEQVLGVMTAADRADASAPERLRAVFAAAGEWFAVNEAAARQLCIARISTLGQRDVPSSRGPLLGLFAEILQAGMDRGELRRVDLDDAVLMVASAYFGPVAAWTWDAAGRPLGERFTGQLDLVLAALAA